MIFHEISMQSTSEKSQKCFMIAIGVNSVYSGTISLVSGMLSVNCFSEDNSEFNTFHRYSKHTFVISYNYLKPCDLLIVYKTKKCSFLFAYSC